MLLTLIYVLFTYPQLISMVPAKGAVVGEKQRQTSLAYQLPSLLPVYHKHNSIIMQFTLGWKKLIASCD